MGDSPIKAGRVRAHHALGKKYNAGVCQNKNSKPTARSNRGAMPTVDQAQPNKKHGNPSTPHARTAPPIEQRTTTRTITAAGRPAACISRQSLLQNILNTETSTWVLVPNTL